MKTYILCHAREVRTFVTLHAETESQAVAKAEKLQQLGICDENVLLLDDQRPKWFVQADQEDNDSGEWEIREVQESLGI